MRSLSGTSWEGVVQQRPAFPNYCSLCTLVTMGTTERHVYANGSILIMATFVVYRSGWPVRSKYSDAGCGPHARSPLCAESFHTSWP